VKREEGGGGKEGKKGVNKRRRGQIKNMVSYRK
jgi:hypothetical protein